MSLIDDALKRARDQTSPPGAAPSVSRPADDPWSYAPLPERRRRRKLAIGAGVAAGTALIAAVFVVASRPRRAEPPPDARAAAASVASAKKTFGRDSGDVPGGAGAGTEPAALASPTPLLRGSSAQPFLPAQPALPSQPAPEGLSDRASAPAALPRIPLSDRELASGSPRIPGAAPSSRTLLSSDSARPAERQRPPAAAGRTYIGSLVAPGGARIELGGIVFSESSPVALLNGRVLAVGGVVEGLRIVAIEENRVELAGEGYTAFLALK